VPGRYGSPPQRAVHIKPFEIEFEQRGKRTAKFYEAETESEGGYDAACFMYQKAAFCFCLELFASFKKVRISNLTYFQTNGILGWEVREMTITKLKAKNQVTIPSIIMKRLRLKPNELFAVDVEGNYIKLIPVKVEPRYTAEELRAIDTIVAQEKNKGKTVKAGKDFSAYLKKVSA